MSGPNRIQLISPYSALEVKKRIAVHAEDKTLWAFRGQKRTVTEITKIDDTTYGFTIRRMPKSSLELNINTSGVSMKGVIVETHGKTIVVAILKTSWWLIWLAMVLIVLMMPVMMFAIYDSTGSFATEMTLLFGVVFGAIVAGTVWSFDREKRIIYNTFMDCVGGDDARAISSDELTLYGWAG